MKTAVGSLSILLLLASTAFCQTWEMFTEEPGNFHVSLPGKPSKHVEAVNTQTGKVEAIYYLVELRDGNQVYAVAYNDYPKGFADKTDVESVLDGVRNGNIKPHNGTVTSETKIKLDGYPGREYTFTGKLGGDGEPVIGHVRIFLVEQRLYQLIVFAAADAEPAKEDIGRFFYSFERLKKSVGRAALGVSGNADGDVFKVSAVSPGSAAQQAGIRVGDIIRTLDGKNVDGYRGLTMLLAGHAPGDSVQLSIDRGGKSLSLSATLKARP